ncbi:dynamin family protein, partial [Mastigocoleus testarum]|uniref:dynamin family protein n=2 Tax=Mastigocoleus testarum TaxID=996925 RepID=UPI000A513C52
MIINQLQGSTPKKINIDYKLNNTRQLLQELGNSISKLVNSSEDVFSDPGIKSSLKEFFTVYQEAVERLENPSFRIATLGTTSSGKSTIVNALIGRKIAPIEAGEMSGGVLSLKHSQQRKLKIADTKDAVWDTGEWTGLSDEDLYQRIRTVMHSYHDARKKREYVAPQVTASVPLLPASDPSFLGLPEGIGIELFDLPGLKSVQDRTNLATIQQQVNKAFSIVALDYMQVDDNHRKLLLEELKKVVEYLQGRTDSMIFILNRVDQRGTDDLPLEERINKLRKEIQEVLSLPKLPDVIPFNARLLYYAQCAWGSGALNEPSQIDGKTRLKLLSAMFQDCASLIKLNTKENKSLKRWFRDIEDQVEDEEYIDDETMRKILHYCLEWSGGTELWKCFRERVKDSFAELVILPALMGVFNHYNALSKKFDVLIDAGKIYNQEQVKRKREKINDIRNFFHQHVKQIGKEFKAEIEELISGLKKHDPQADLEVVKNAKEKGYEGFNSIVNAVSGVEADLTKYLIAPVRYGLNNNQLYFQLRDKLQEVVSPALADDIAKTYDNVSRRLKSFSRESEYFVKSVRTDNDKGKKELEHDERHVRLLYHTMKVAMSARAEFFLQGKAKQFEQALESFVDEQVKRLKNHLSEQTFASLIDLENAAISDLQQKLDKNLPTLPDKFFEVQYDFKLNHTRKTEVIGQKTEYETRTKTEYESNEETYEEGSCFKETKTRTKTQPVTREYQEEVTRDVTGEVEYINMFLPSPDLMAKQWSSGVKKKKESLWVSPQNSGVRSYSGIHDQPKGLEEDLSRI